MASLRVPDRPLSFNPGDSQGRSLLDSGVLTTPLFFGLVDAQPSDQAQHTEPVGALLWSSSLFRALVIYAQG